MMMMMMMMMKFDINIITGTLCCGSYGIYERKCPALQL